MVQVGANDLRGGMKIEVDGQPYNIVSIQFVKPGKGQAFNRLKLKHLMTERTIEWTCKSGEMVALADVQQAEMRLLYVDQTGATFMDDTSYEQFIIPTEKIEEIRQWLQEDIIYGIVFYKGEAISVEPPTFMEMEIIETAPGVRGDTASGRVLKPATLHTGAKIQVPIFIEQGERIKVDTRTGEYVSRVK